MTQEPGQGAAAHAAAQSAADAPAQAAGRSAQDAQTAATGTPPAQGAGLVWAPSRDKAVRKLTGSVFVALVIASFAAFFIAQRLKHTPTAIQLFYVDEAFHPEGGPKPRREAITFQLQRPDHVTVEIWSSPQAGNGSSSTVVATLAKHRVVAAYAPLELAWNGRLGAHRDGADPPIGPPAPAGEYRVRVILAHQKVEMFSPRDFTLIRRRHR